MATNFDATRLAVQTAFPTNDLLFDDKEMPSIHVFIPKFRLGWSTALRPARSRCWRALIRSSRGPMRIWPIFSTTARLRAGSGDETARSVPGCAVLEMPSAVTATGTRR